MQFCEAYWRGRIQTLFTAATTVSEDMAPGEGQVVESSAGNLGYISGIWHSTRRAVQLHGELTPGFTPSPHLQQHHLRVHVSTQSCIHSRTRALTYALIHSLTHSLAHSLSPVLTHPLIHSLTHSLTHSITHALTRSLAHSLAHPKTRSLTHSHTASPKIRYTSIFDCSLCGVRCQELRAKSWLPNSRLSSSCFDMHEQLTQLLC